MASFSGARIYFKSARRRKKIIDTWQACWRGARHVVTWSAHVCTSIQSWSLSTMSRWFTGQDGIADRTFNCRVIFLIRFSACLSVYRLSACPSICPSTYLPACPPVSLSGNVSVYMPAWQPVFLSDCQPVCLSTCLVICLPDNLSVCLLVNLSVYPSTCLFICMPVNLSICLPVKLSVCQRVWLSVNLSAYFSACQSVCLSACLSTCLSVCMSASRNILSYMAIV